MALNVPNIFPPTEGGPVVQYNALDIVQGIGYVSFYAAYAASHAVAEQASYGILTPSAVFSDKISTVDPGVNLGDAWAKAASHNFISNEFTQSAVLNGNIFVQIPVAVRGSATIGEGHRVRPEIRFFKVLSDGSSEALTDAQSCAAVFTGGTTWVSKVALVEANINNKTIRPNERLRMDMVVWTKANAAGTETPTPYIAHDPQGRINSLTGDFGWSDSGSGNTILKIDIPFKLDR